MYKKVSFIMLFIIVCSIFSGCNRSVLMYDFEDSTLEFAYGVANVVQDYETKGYGVVVKQAEIPNLNSNGLMISAYNMDENMFVYFYINVGNTLKLDAEKKYEAELAFDVATMMPKASTNITDKIPAQSVIIKAGLLPDKPSTEKKDGIITPDFKIGHYMTDEEYIKALGNIQKNNFKSSTSFEYKTFNTTLAAQTDKEGNLYLLIGVDSYYIGPTWIFIDNIKFEIK